MKKGIIFFLVYIGCCILLLLISKHILHDFDTETEAFLLLFLIHNLFLGIILFPLVYAAVRRLELADVWKNLIYFFTILLILNVPFLFEDGHLLTLEVFKDISGNSMAWHSSIAIPIQLISIIGFCLSLTIPRSKNKRRQGRKA